MTSNDQTYSLPSQPVPLNPISLVDTFFPGLNNISAVLQQLQAGSLNSYGGILCICGIVVFLGKYAYKYLRELVTTYFTSTVHVSHSDEAYDMLVTWVSSQPFAHRASSFLASVGAARRGLANGYSDGSKKKPLQYSPWNGSFSFWYKNRLLTFRSVQNENRFFPKEEISVSCIGMSSKILMDLFAECRIEYLKLVEKKTSVFKHPDGNWQKTKTMDIRQLDTIILNEQKKTALLNDIKSFLEPESRACYSRCGIPYRKGYLFYGPPGSGKSSLSLSIAGHCDLDVYTLNLSGVDDTSLDELFTELPARCVILLEDIDAVDATQSRQQGTGGPRQDETRSSTKGKPRGELSLSTLLNALDGVGSQEGRILIMTTNHVERLDAALIRAGRVDMKVELELTDRDTNIRLFSNMFLRDSAPDEGKGAEDKIPLEKLATDFAAMVPEQEFSPAEIQSFLLEHMKSPHMAVQNVQEWITRTREEKRHIARGDPWVSEKRFRSDNHTTPPDKTASLSATTQDGEMASAVAAVETPIPTIDSHCCSCQVLEDIRVICAAKEMPSIEQSLLLNYLSDLENYRSSHADLDHSTPELLNLLLDFVKNIYTSSTERHSTQPAVSARSSNLPPASGGELLLPAQTAPKIDEEGWEPISDFNDTTPGLSYHLHGLDYTYSDAEFSEMSPDNSSSGTSFESGSEMSCDVEAIVKQAEVREEPLRLESGCRSSQQPTTPPASPTTSTNPQSSN